MKKKIVLISGVVLLTFIFYSFSTRNENKKTITKVELTEDACIYGTAYRKDGSKVDGTIKVSTSWNNEKAFPKKGKYRLCLGSNPKKTITIYVDGMKYGKVRVDSDTEFNIQLD
jgi:lysine/ornithine N-monooxygenase